ncbi:hypothetical protein CFR71_05485 [Novacetimonas pomaceti]|uniref:Uncharacterized protein n=1 Tax=Novacetimonas pomaceti TaxID=2021998 RepID=A0A318QCI2_9PROT|nr:hypothetical protein CFR71_05485 [Novacetimonas pomaceti]
MSGVFASMNIKDGGPLSGPPFFYAIGAHSRQAGRAWRRVHDRKSGNSPFVGEPCNKHMSAVLLRYIVYKYGIV